MSKINKQTTDSPLFSLTSVVKQSTSPVVVVGLPRSGSTFLSSVLSALDSWYVFDDLYLYQMVKGLQAEGILNSEQLQELVERLGWTVRARVKFEQHFLKPQCTWEDVDRMVEAVLETFKEQSLYWHELLEEWLMRLALHHGKTRWGYKTPQDFMHMDLLTKIFPDIRFIFIVRDPLKVMASMKYVNQQDGKPQQYHPLAYALYWKMAYEKVHKFINSKKAPVHVVKFEDLVADPHTEAKHLANFLGTTLSSQISNKGSNTSFASHKRREITKTEAWICEYTAGKTIKLAGYNLQGAYPRLKDLPDLLATSTKFLLYQIQRIYQRKEQRSSIFAYLKFLFEK